MLAAFSGMLGHFAESRSSGLSGRGRDRLEKVSYAIFLLALAVLAIKAVTSIIAYLQTI